MKKAQSSHARSPDWKKPFPLELHETFGKVTVWGCMLDDTTVSITSAQVSNECSSINSVS
jgi:hypothetical protein